MGFRLIYLFFVVFPICDEETEKTVGPLNPEYSYYISKQIQERYNLIKAIKP